MLLQGAHESFGVLDVVGEARLQQDLAVHAQQSSARIVHFQHGAAVVHDHDRVTACFEYLGVAAQEVLLFAAELVDLEGLAHAQLQVVLVPRFGGVRVDAAFVHRVHHGFQIGIAG